jgi:hypothetical protein
MKLPDSSTPSKPAPRRPPRRGRFPAHISLLLAVLAPLRAGYVIENVPYPAGLHGGISAVAFTPAGALVLATRHGEIWVRRAGAAADDPAAWRRFASGLDEPMGVIAESERVVLRRASA